MVSATVNGVTTTYVYDDAGNRVGETTGGVTTFYLTDDNNPTGYAQPIEQKPGATGAPSVTYVIGDRVLAQADTLGVVSCFLTDGHGSTRALTSSTGAVAQTFSYTAFGGAVGFDPATAGTVFLFGGDAVYDPMSELYLNGDGTRPRDGFIFTQMDGYTGDVSAPLSLHKYLYAAMDPVGNWDPSGHDFTAADVVTSLGLDKNLEGEEDEAGAQVANRALRTKQFDVYVGLSRGGLSPGSAIFIPHTFLYVASKEFGAGQAFDVARDYLKVHPETLKYEESQSIFLYRFAEFTPLQYAQWTATAYVIASVATNDEGLPASGRTYWDDIQLAFSFSFVEKTVNCYKFSLLAGLDALATSRLPI
jgi:YD repeat-containing protein